MNRNKHVSQDVLATKGLRFANYIIDQIVMVVLGGAIGVLIALYTEFTGDYGLYDVFVESDNTLLDYLIGYIISLIYYTTIETLTGRSLGKYITKTKVVTHEGEKPTFDTILIRTLCRFIPFNHFSFLGEDGKGWHDSISKTYVVEVKKFEEKIETEFELDQIGKLPE